MVVAEAACAEVLQFGVAPLIAEARSFGGERLSAVAPHITAAAAIAIRTINIAVAELTLVVAEFIVAARS